MRLALEITMDNAAFEESGELTKILEGVAKRLDHEHPHKAGDSGALRDSNGNHVGHWAIFEN